MTPFSNGQFTEFPYPPVDIPTPDVAAADFATIGQQFEAGKKAADKADTSVPGFLNWISWIVAKILAALLNCLLSIVTKLLALVFQFFNQGDENMDALAAAAVGGMLGVADATGTQPSAVQKGRRDTLSANLANLLQQGLEKGAQMGSDGTLQPGNQGANNFLKMSAHMAIEGWLQGIIVEVSSANYLERFADLKDTLENAFGMGRLARRALAAPMKILVEDPYTWKLNQTFHPALLSPGEAVRFYLRGGIDRNGLQAIMDKHGYLPAVVDELIYDQAKPLTMPEILDLIARKIYTTNDALAALRKQGYDDATAALALGVASRLRGDAFNRRGAEEALGLYRQRKIDRPTYDGVIRNTQLAPDEQTMFSGLADIVDYGNRTRFSMGEGETLVKKGIWNLDQFRDLATYHGYQLGDETDLELLLLTEIKDAADAAAKKAAAAQAAQQRAQAKAAAAQAKAQAAAAMAESKGVSVAQYETLVTDNLRTLTDYYNYLVRKGVAADNAQALQTALQMKLATKAAAASAKAAAAGNAKAKNLDVTQLETAVQQGLISLADFTTRMEQIGMSSADAQLLAQELQHRIDDAAAKAKATADAKAAAAVKHVDLSQEERAVLLGTQTIQQYGAFLDAHGFAPEDRDVLVSELSAQLSQAQATAAKKAAAAKSAATKGINLTQLERLVRAGIKTVADYQTALANLGYSAGDQADLVKYLQLQMEQDQQNLITKGHAADLVGQLGVSLTDLERAVKLGVVPIATYQDALARAGVSAADQQTMVQTLAAQIKTTRAQQTAAQSVSKQVAAAGVSLATLEKDTENGRLSLEQFQALLAGYGVPESQITDVVALVQDQIDNKNAVQALVADATARAAAKGLNLSQDTAAYKQGVLTEQEWRSRVASLGYDAADVEILFETLAAAQAAAAAKSAKKTTTATTAAAAAGTSAGAGG